MSNQIEAEKVGHGRVNPSEEGRKSKEKKGRAQRTDKHGQRARHSRTVELGDKYQE